MSRLRKIGTEPACPAHAQTRSVRASGGRTVLQRRPDEYANASLSPGTPRPEHWWINLRGRSPDSRVIIAGRPSQNKPSGRGGRRLADYSCGGSPGFPVRIDRAPDSLFIPSAGWRRETSKRTRTYRSCRDVAWVLLRVVPPAPTFQTELARSVCAAATIFLSAGMTSAHWRVLRPQSGFTHSRSAGMRSAAFLIRPTMYATVGMFGEWTS